MRDVSVIPIFAAILQLQQGGGSTGLIWTFLPLVFIFGIFYFLLIMPQQRRQRKWQEMLAGLKAGDKVITSGGIKGTIVSVKDDSIQLRVPPDSLRIEVLRTAVVSIASDEVTK